MAFNTPTAEQQQQAHDALPYALSHRRDAFRIRTGPLLELAQGGDHRVTAVATLAAISASTHGPAPVVSWPAAAAMLIATGAPVGRTTRSLRVGRTPTQRVARELDPGLVTAPVRRPKAAL